MHGPPTSHLPWGLKAGRYDEKDEILLKAMGPGGTLSGPSRSLWYGVTIRNMKVPCHQLFSSLPFCPRTSQQGEASMMQRTDNTFACYCLSEAKRKDGGFKQASKWSEKGCADVCSLNYLPHWLFCCRIHHNHVRACAYLTLHGLWTAQSFRLSVMFYYWSDDLSDSSWFQEPWRTWVPVPGWRLGPHRGGREVPSCSARWSASRYEPFIFT